MNKNGYNYNSITNYGSSTSKCGCPCQPTPKPCDDSYVVGNSIDFTIDNCDSEIKADVVVDYRDSVRVWGQVKDCTGKPVEYAYIKLIKATNNGYIGIAHTITDCLGFYQFDICPCKDGTNFRLLVGKASTGGNEKDISSEQNCNPCVDAPSCECR